MQKVTPERHGRLAPPWENDTRLIFSPTGRPLRRGEGYFAYLGSRREWHGATHRSVSENWLLLGEELSEQPFGVALRFFNHRLSADVGLVFVGEVLDEGLPIPWLSFSYHFGRPKAGRR